jgi:hypothetical protein
MRWARERKIINKPSDWVWRLSCWKKPTTTCYSHCNRPCHGGTSIYLSKAVRKSWLISRTSAGVQGKKVFFLSPQKRGSGKKSRARHEQRGSSSLSFSGWLAGAVVYFWARLGGGSSRVATITREISSLWPSLYLHGQSPLARSLGTTITSVAGCPASWRTRPPALLFIHHRREQARELLHTPAAADCVWAMRLRDPPTQPPTREHPKGNGTLKLERARTFINTPNCWFCSLSFVYTANAALGWRNAWELIEMRPQCMVLVIHLVCPNILYFLGWWLTKKN